jgi:hypothetical protein
MHTHNPPPPGRPLWFTLRAAFVFPREVAPDLTWALARVVGPRARQPSGQRRFVGEGGYGEANGQLLGLGLHGL